MALAMGSLILAYYGLTFSVAQVMVRSDAALAHQLAPYDGRITAAYAASLAGDDATRDNRRQGDDLARRALRQDPTAVAALSTLGINADFRGDKVVAQRMFSAANTLSRRNLAAQLWMIENAVAHGNVPQTLRQYDVTLRVFPAMGGILYPVLASASTDPVIRRELVKTLVSKPAWGADFISSVAGSSADPQATAILFDVLRRAGVAVPDAAHASVVNALVAAGYINSAWTYYAAGRSGADRRRSRDPRFSTKTNNSSQLDWVALNDGGLSTSIQGGKFDFFAPPSVGGPILQQYQLLPPGRYRMIGHSVGIDISSNAHPYWTLLCRNGRKLGRVVVPNSNVGNGAFSGTFDVPADCPVQILVLNARPSDAVSGQSGQIDRAELIPVSH